MTALRAYAELIRLPNVFTAAGDILAGYWLVSATFDAPPALWLLVLASAALYAAGIVFNDLHDIETDRAERPSRPLPSGRVSAVAARRLGIGLSLAGVGAAMLAGRGMGHGGAEAVALMEPTTVVAVLLLIAIVAYDFAAKETGLGPVVMGACRGLNLLLGMSLVWSPGWDFFAIAPAAMFLYVAALTWFGRDEATLSAKRRLAAGGAGVMFAVLVVGIFAASNRSNDALTPVVWLALLIHLGRVTIRAIRIGSPVWVRYAMKTFILGIIPFDAVLAWSAHGWPAGLAVLALLVPALYLGRWVYST